MAEGIDDFAKGSVNFTIGKLIEELEAFERFVRLVGGRRNFTSGFLALRAYPRHSGRSLQILRLVGSRHGCRSPGTRGLGTVGFAE